MKDLFSFLLFILLGLGIIFVLWILRRPESKDFPQQNDKKTKLKYKIENTFLLWIVVAAFIFGIISFFLTFPLIGDDFSHLNLAKGMAIGGLLINFLVAARFGEIKGGRMGGGAPSPVFKKEDPNWVRAMTILLFLLVVYCAFTFAGVQNETKRIFEFRFLGSLVMLFSFLHVKKIVFGLLDIFRSAK